MSFPSLGSFYQRLLFLLPFATDVTHKQSFSYNDPTQWFLDFPQCLGFKQSPISISSQKALSISLPPLLFYSYDVLLGDVLHLRNNGHTVEFPVPETIQGEIPFITGGLMTDLYEAEAVHFHWGSPTHKGSEHLLNGRRYDMEMHIVHKNTKYINLEVARDFHDGIAVIAVLFKVVKSPNLYYAGLSEVFNALEELVEHNSTSSTTELITLGSLLGNINREHYFTYKGSLTTPPCSEAVTWHVFPEVLPIPQFELMKFWNLLDSKGRELVNNFRPLQQLERRKVYYQKPTLSYFD